MRAKAAIKQLCVPHMPAMLGKELAEAAARKRTYVVRFVHTGLLFGLFAILLLNVTRDTAGMPLAAIGSGRWMFQAIVRLQFMGIILFMPALSACVITDERERGSLQLLTLAGLKPAAILTQKYLGAIFPMLTVLLVSLPLFAVAYAFGGVTAGDIGLVAYLLPLTCCQVAACGLFCSCYCRTSTKAFVVSYVLIGTLYFGLGVLALIVVQLSGGTVGLGSGSEDIMFALCPPVIFEMHWGSAPSRSQAEALVQSVPVLFCTGFFLALARGVFTPVEPKRPKRLTVTPLKSLERLVKHRWPKLCESRIPPDGEPVAWLDVKRHSLGKARLLLHVLVFVEIPILVLAAFACLLGRTQERAAALSFLVGGLWLVAMLLVTVHSADSIAGERYRQTLDVLLTTPLSGAQIVSQKMRATRRFILVLLIPFITLYAIEAVWEHAAYLNLDSGPYVAASLLCLVAFLPTCAWLSQWIGMRSRTRFRAAVTSLTAVAAWNVLPILVQWLVARDSMIALFSPLAMVAAAESGELRYMWGGVWTTLFVVFYFNLAALYYFRWACLVEADTHLGRIPTPPAGKPKQL